MKVALTIAGSDSCGGAGIQADIKSISANGVYAMSVITAVTAQNTQGVYAIQDIDDEIITKQIEVLFDDIEIDAIKIGMVSKSETIKAIAKTLRKYNYQKIVLDPVMISKSGFNLLKPEAKATLIEELIPMALVITPNLPEAEAITNLSIKNIDGMKTAAKAIYKLGPKYVLIKGGHLDTSHSTDVLFDGNEYHLLISDRLNTVNTHGTGCTLSSAIAANIAKGMNVILAIESAKEYITNAIKYSFKLGKGVGPTHHFHKFYQINKKDN